MLGPFQVWFLKKKGHAEPQHYWLITFKSSANLSNLPGFSRWQKKYRKEFLKLFRFVLIRWINRSKYQTSCSTWHVGSYKSWGSVQLLGNCLGSPNKEMLHWTVQGKKLVTFTLFLNPMFRWREIRESGGEKYFKRTSLVTIKALIVVYILLVTSMLYPKKTSLVTIRFLVIVYKTHINPICALRKTQHTPTQQIFY